MSVQDEREIRERLAGLLEGLEPRPAPVARAVRQGRGIRMRRWVCSAVGLAVIAGGAAALPALVHRHPAQAPIAPRHYTATVNPPGKDAPAGLISSGTQDGHPWQVIISGHGNNAGVTGVGHVQEGGGALGPLSGKVVSTDGGGDSGPGGSMMIVGVVRGDVTRVAIGLSGGTTLNLTPVRYDGQNYIGVVYPYGVPIVSAVAYHGSLEVAYSVPRAGMWLDNWWLPGQAGPARFTKTIASGSTDGHPWRFTAAFGPWGYCYDMPGGSSCSAGAEPRQLPAGQSVLAFSCGGLYDGEGANGPSGGLAVARSDVRQVELTLSGGGTERYSTVDVQGAQMFAFVLPHGQRIVGTREFGAAGQVVDAAPAKEMDICS
jgi:hypothetical protein